MLAAILIVKGTADEAAHLERCLKSIQGHVDGIFLNINHLEGVEIAPSVQEVAKKYTENIIETVWHDNFSEARNANLAQSLGQFNAGQLGGMSQFNAGQGNQLGQFNATLGQNNNQFNAAQGNSLNTFNAGQGNQMLGQQRNLNQNADQFNQNMDFNTWQANNQNMRNGSLDQMNFLGQLLGMQGQGVAAGTQVQNTPLNYWQQFLQGATQAGGSGGTASQNLQGNPYLGALAGWNLFNGFGGGK